MKKGLVHSGIRCSRWRVDDDDTNNADNNQQNKGEEGGGEGEAEADEEGEEEEAEAGRLKGGEEGGEVKWNEGKQARQGREVARKITRIASSPYTLLIPDRPPLSDNPSKK